MPKEDGPPAESEIHDIQLRATRLKQIYPYAELKSGEERTQFGNNFYLLFLARLRRIHNPNSILIKIYLERAEALGEPWRSFVEDNQELLVKIEALIIDQQVLGSLLRLYRDFFRLKLFDEADAFDNQIDSNHGINAIGVPIWRELNILLEKAAEAMKKAGIEPQQFFG